MTVLRRLRVPCHLAGRPGHVHVVIGHPAPGFHPLHFQTAWLRESRGGEVPEEILEVLRQGSGELVGEPTSEGGGDEAVEEQPGEEEEDRGQAQHRRHQE